MKGIEISSPDTHVRDAASVGSPTAGSERVVTEAIRPVGRQRFASNHSTIGVNSSATRVAMSGREVRVNLEGVPTSLFLETVETGNVLGADAECAKQENVFVGAELNAAVNEEVVDRALSSTLEFVVYVFYVTVAVGVAVGVVAVITPPVVLFVLCIMLPLATV